MVLGSNATVGTVQYPLPTFFSQKTVTYPSPPTPTRQCPSGERPVQGGHYMVQARLLLAVLLVLSDPETS